MLGSSLCTATLQQSYEAAPADRSSGTNSDPNPDPDANPNPDPNPDSDPDANPDSDPNLDPNADPDQIDLIWAATDLVPFLRCTFLEFLHSDLSTACSLIDVITVSFKTSF